MILLAAVAAGVVPARAGGPLWVTGPEATQPGKAYRWALNPIPYQTDLGGLGNQTNTEANNLVSAAFQVWHNVSTANISFQSAGQLGYDVTASTVASFYNAVANCGDAGQAVNSIVYDFDGSAIEELGLDNNSTLGFSEILCSDDENGLFTRGWVMLNGWFLSASSGNQNVTLEEFQATFIHEFGHLIGLDHSQINLDCLTQISCPTEDMAGVPTMFPVLIDLSMATLKKDDIAALSSIYPAADFGLTTGRIQGRVLFADGQTQAQGYNVIARLVGDPRRTAVSCVSGYLYTAGVGNPFLPPGYDTDLPFGSRDPTLIGYYDIPGLPAGEYTIEVEALNNSGLYPFIYGSSVGPIGNDLGFQFKMPGICDLQYLNYPSSPGDSCSAKSTVTVGAGTIVNTNTDVIILGTPPRYDAWEDGP
jgi:hypothetical protein